MYISNLFTCHIYADSEVAQAHMNPRLTQKHTHTILDNMKSIAFPGPNEVRGFL